MSDVEPKLIPEPPLLVLPSLAVAIGLNEAILLQQIHFRTRESADEWWRAGAGELPRAFPFWSESTIKRATRSLEKARLVDVRQAGTDRAKQYRVQYDAIHRLKLPSGRPSGSGQSEPVSITEVRKRTGNGKRGDGSA